MGILRSLWYALRPIRDFIISSRSRNEKESSAEGENYSCFFLTPSKVLVLAVGGARLLLREKRRIRKTAAHGMCGRCAATVSPHVIEKIAGSKVFHGSERYRTNYNCTPQCHLPCILPGTESTYELNALRWGINAVGQHKPVINARSENLKSSPLWRKLLKKRCVVVVQGYYEWLNETKSAKKKPFFIHHSSTGEYACLDAPAVVKEVKEENERRASTGFKSPALKKVKEEDVQFFIHHSSTGEYACLDAPAVVKEVKEENERRASTGLKSPALKKVKEEDVQNSCGASSSLHAEKGKAEYRPLMLAGLYGDSNDASAAGRCVILTMSSMGLPAEAIHDRAPVILDEASARCWLSNVEFDQAFPLVMKTAKTVGQQNVTFYEVSTLVSSVKNNGCECIMPLQEYTSKQYQEGIGRFFKALPSKRKRPSSVDSST